MTPKNMSLQDWLKKLECLHPSEIDMGLDRCQIVYRSLLESNKDFLTPIKPKVIVVGGTNGKGSTIATMEQALLAKGFAVGVYTSPHLHEYNERVRLNGLAVSNNALVSSFQKIDRLRQDTSLTYFEFGTLAALDIFNQQSLDFLLLEVGLGGRLDAVNIVDSDISIITSIDFDHTDWLGLTLDQIGFEKSGIFRCKQPAVLGVTDPPESVMVRAEQLDVPLIIFDRDFGVGDKFQVSYPEFETHIPQSNICCAFQALNLLGVSFTAQEQIEIVATLKLPGRFEQLSAFPELWVDVGHNPEAARFMLSQLPKIAGDKPIYALFSALGDKEVEQVMKILSGTVFKWFLAPLDAARAMSLVDLTEIAKLLSLNYSASEDIASALSEAESEGLAENAFIIGFGSFYTVSALRELKTTGITL